MIVMKKNSLKLNELVRSELELTEQAVIKGGGGNDGDAPPPGGETCYCVIVTTLLRKEEGVQQMKPIVINMALQRHKYI